MSSPHTRLRALRLETWDADAEVIRRIFNEAWVENWGHVPMEKEEWTYQADQLKQVILRDLSWIVEVDGHPAGFMIVVKDLSAALKQARGRLFPTGLLRLLWRSRNIDRARILIMGLLKPYQGQGYDLVMAIESLKRGTKAGYVFCDCSQIAESNHRITGNLERLGARRYKTFRLYRKTLA
jgi:GNAT superfamily N-acetyltransferase